MIKNLLKSLFLVGALLLAPTIEAQWSGKFPTNVRFIGGGYNDQRPFFKTLEAALNDVKAYATTVNPYAFWISSDTVWISDWDSVFTESGLTMKDSIDVYYVATGKIKWFPIGFGGTGTSTTIVSPDDTTLHYGWDTWNTGNTALPQWQRDLGGSLDDIDQEVWNLIVYTKSPLYIENDTLKIDTTNLVESSGWNPDTTTILRTTGNQSFSGTKTNTGTLRNTGTLDFSGSGNIQLPNSNGSTGTARRIWADNDKIYFSGSGASDDSSYTAMIDYDTKYLECDTCLAYSNISQAVKDSLGRGGTATFTGTASSLAVTVSGMTASSIVVVTPVYTDSSTAIDAQDLMVVIPHTGGFYVKRSLAGTSNLKINWAWIRKQN